MICIADEISAMQLDCNTQTLTNCLSTLLRIDAF